MGTPKKTIKKKSIPKSSGAKKTEDEAIDPKTKKKIIDEDDDDEDFDISLDELGGYESFEGYEEDDDF
jgi:hypothetical protein